MEVVMQAEDDAYKVDRHDDHEEGEEEFLIRKSKSTKDGVITDKIREEGGINVEEEVDSVEKFNLYFEEEEEEEEVDKYSGQTVDNLASSNGYMEKCGRIEQASGHQTVEVPVFSNGFMAKEATTMEEIDAIPSEEDGTEEGGPETTQVDLKIALAEQNTYNLYCPNCKSCITRRVVLRKRKRTVQKYPDEVEPEKFEDHPPDVKIHDPRVTEESEVFGCLKCFTVFIRTATGYEFLSKIFWAKDGEDHSQDTPVQQEEDTAAAQDENSVNLKIVRREPEDTDNEVARKCTENCSVEPSNLSRVVNEKDSQTDELQDLPVRVVDQRIPTSPNSSTHETVIEVEENKAEVIARISSIPERVDVDSDGLDILKSIVYGGLAESIASLGVISSAAGGDASTLNILALGLANLIGGLLVIAHNIAELKEDTVRCAELIGRRQNFWRNAFVVIVSYILFGLVAPVTYGFSFRKSDNKEYKIAAVAISSLLCIIILAVGKARVTAGSYIKKVLFYVGLGVWASGISYAVGVFIRKLLEKLGWISESQSTSHSSYLTMGTNLQTWIS